MARGKVAEWIRKRTMPRKSASRRRGSSASGATEPILREAATESWSGASSPAPTKAASKLRPSALWVMLRWRPHVNVVAVLYETAAYNLMWLVESVVVVGTLVFFVMRFGLKQL